MASETKCVFIGKLGKWIWLIYVVLCVVIKRTSFTLADSPEKGGENNGCTNVKVAWGSKGFDTSHVPISTITGEHLQVCSQGFTCCSAQMESKLNLLGRQDFNRTLSEKIGQVRQSFVSQTSKYDAFCTELIDKASRDLHDMFLKTYGVLYQQNSKIFSELFRNLKRYYQGSDLNLEDVLESFFATLMQQMFKLLNANYAFDNRYLQCVTENMDELKPFGDVPKKLSTQVKRAFIATRTFHQGLAIGKEVINAVSKMDVSQACLRAVTKMSWCPYCRGFTHLKPCSNYCLNVMKGCLAYHYELNEAWNTYIDSLSKVAERLEGPFNIESVVDPIDVKISDAIMNFQENNEEVSKKVFSGCGQPTLATRKKRQIDDDMNFDWKQSGVRQGNSRPATAAGTNIDRLMQEFREKIATSKELWKELPLVMCSGMAAPVREESMCWNGLNKNRYLQPVVGDGITNQVSNPDVDVDVRKTNPIINQQILQLKMITEKLKKAFNGLDVDYSDISDGSSDASGSGDDGEFSGSGDIAVRGGDIYFSTSVRPHISIRTMRPYMPSQPPQTPRTRHVPSGAPGFYELPWRAPSYIVFVLVVLKSI